MQKSSESKSFRLDPQRLREGVLQAMDLLEEHLTALPHGPVKPHVKPGSVAAGFASQAPETPQDLSALVNVIKTQILPAITNWQHPKFFAYYPASTSIPAIISELIISTLGAIGLQWSSSPASTELECVIMDWILALLDAPKDSPFFHVSKKGGGIIQNSAGEALATIMVAARVNHHIKEKSAGASKIELEDMYWQDSSSLVVYTSDQTHFAGPKAIRVAGMRRHQIPASKLANGNFGITASQVRQAMDEDRKKGLTPCAVLLNFGSTNTCGYDDLESFRGFREQEQLWVHVDAAYAGPSMILPEFRERSLLLQEVASSFNFNGSKWFLCGFDSAFLFVRDRQLLKRVFTADDEFMVKVKEEETYNPEFKDWSIPLGRRFRALRIWMVLSYFGRDGLRTFLRKSIDEADIIREKIDSSGVLKQPVKTDLGLVCFRLASDDEQKNNMFIQRILELSDSGQKFLIYPSLLEGKGILRFAMGGIHTEQEDVDSVFNLCLETAREIEGSPSRV